MEIYAVRCDVRFTQGTHLEGENGTQKKNVLQVNKALITACCQQWAMRFLVP